MTVAPGPLRVVAIDDEMLALRRIEQAIATFPDVELTGTAMSGEVGLELIGRTRPDVILLDIQMAAFGGFEMLQAMTPAKRPLVIFVTAFETYALRAFDVAAVDYVMKPVRFERLQAALERAREISRGTSSAARELAAPSRDLWAHHRGTKVRVPAAKLDWLEADRDYVKLHSEGGTFLMRGPMSAILDALPDGEFIRIRRSAAVRIEAIIAVRQRRVGDTRLKLRNGLELRVGGTYATSVQRLFKPPSERGKGR